MKYRCGCCFIVLTEYADLIYALYLLKLPTDKSHKVLNRENVEAKVCEESRGHVISLVLFSNESVNLAVYNRLAL